MRVINLLLFIIILLSNCTPPSNKCSCFKNTRLQNQKSYISEFDSIFRRNIHLLNFSKKFKEGSISQVLFLEIDLVNKSVSVIAEGKSESKKAQSKYFKEYTIKLLDDFNYILNRHKKFVIPILIHRINPNLDKVLESEDCKYYHKRLKKYKKSQIKMSREFCFASSGKIT